MANISSAILDPQESFFRASGLNEAQVFRLFKAALKDDDALIDALIHKLYFEMKVFDRRRADDTIELVVDRDRSAPSIFRSLLDDVWPEPPAAAF